MRFQHIFLLLVFGLLCFTACEKQNIDETNTKEEEVVPDVVTCNLTLNFTENPAGTITATIGNGTAPYVYNWSTSDSTSVITVDTSGTYILTVIDSLGCAITSTIDVQLNTNPCLSLAVSLEENPQGTILTTTTGGTAPYTYLWATGQTTSDITVQSNGTYLVYVTDSNGCMVEGALNITSFTNPCGAFGIEIAEPAIGALTAIPVGGNPPFAYAWSTGETTQSITVTADGFYNISITDDIGCYIDTVYQVVGFSNPCATLTGLITADASTGHLSAAASGGTAPYTYSWSTGETGSSIVVTTNGSYTVIITDSQGCTFTTTKFVTVNDPCFGLAMNLMSNPNGVWTLQSVTGGTPPYAYLWSNGSTSSFATMSAPGTYWVSVTDSVGCVITETFIIP